MEFFELTVKKYGFLLEDIGDVRYLNKGCPFTSKNYVGKNFMDFGNLKNGASCRFLPNEWPLEFKDFVVVFPAKKLLLLFQTDTSNKLKRGWKNYTGNPEGNGPP